MMTRSDSDEDRSDPDVVRLGSLEVDPAELEAPGSSLWDLIGGRKLTLRSPDDLLDLPSQGWRPIFPSWEFIDNPREIFAAPHPHQRNAWVLVFLHWIGEAWTVSTDPGPVPMRRSNAARRAGLELRWPAEQTATAGTLPELSVDLLNTADHLWTNDVGDHMTVRGWALGPDDQPLGTGVQVFANAPRLPDLAPGDRMSLRVNPGSDIEDLAPGRYRLVAELLDLELRSPPGTLVLTEPDIPR
ncbi:hypothetical protein CA951_13590 [Rhodococcus sp. NCIMB 12038]|jgi:hypothetical protein|nr:hypothetical protein CA951_13590 [Rhodococcus sp. NCIMB 12038]